MVEEDLEKWRNARLDSHEVSVTGWICDVQALAYAMIVAVFLNRNGHPGELIAPTKQLCEALESSDWTAATVYRNDLSLLLRDREGCFDPSSHSAFDVVMHQSSEHHFTSSKHHFTSSEHLFTSSEHLFTSSEHHFTSSERLFSLATHLFRFAQHLF